MTHQIRKQAILHETIYSEGGLEASVAINRVAGIAVIANPFAGRSEHDLTSLFDLGHDLAEHLMKQMVPALPGPAVSYGKAAMVGVNGDLELAHAMLHPKLGAAMRGAIGGGAALIPSSAKIGAAGAVLDVPLGHKDEAWSRNHFDAMSVCLPDSPRPDEIMLAIVIADGGRPVPRAGQGKVAASK